MFVESVFRGFPAGAQMVLRWCSDGAQMVLKGYADYAQMTAQTMAQMVGSHRLSRNVLPEL